MTQISTQSLIHTLTSKGEKAFFVAFADYGLADIADSVVHIAAMSELDYLHQHKEDLLALLAAVEQSLQPKKSTLSKLKQIFSSMFGMAVENMTHLIADLEKHRSKLLIENASLRQLNNHLTTNQQNMQLSLCFIDKLLASLQQQTPSRANAINRITQRKIQIQQQQLVVNNALLAITTSTRKNKEIVASINTLLNTRLSAYLLHDIANKLTKP